MSDGARRNQLCACGSGRKYKRCCGKPFEPSVETGSEEEPELVEAPQIRTVDGGAVLVLLPTRGNMKIETAMCLASNLDGLNNFKIPCARKGVEDARNELAAIAQLVPAKAPFTPRDGWFCLWIDDDAFWPDKTIAKLLTALYRPGVDVITGWFTGRDPNSPPKAIRIDGTWPQPGKDCKSGAIVEVERVGFHFVAHKLSVLEKLGPNPFTVDGTDERGEDFAFCKRARDAGLRIWTHTGCPVGHVDEDGTVYLPWSDPHAIVAGEMRRIDAKRLYTAVN